MGVSPLPHLNAKTHMLQTSSTHNGKLTRLGIAGSLDGVTAAQLTEAVLALVADSRHHIVADFSGVSYASSAGLRAVLMGVKETRKLGGDLRLCAVQPSVLKVLQMAGFTQLIQTFTDFDAAKKSFG